MYLIRTATDQLKCNICVENHCKCKQCTSMHAWALCVVDVDKILSKCAKMHVHVHVHVYTCNIYHPHYPTAHMQLRTCLLVFSTMSCLSSLVSSQLAVPCYAFFEAEQA